MTSAFGDFGPVATEDALLVATATCSAELLPPPFFSPFSISLIAPIPAPTRLVRLGVKGEETRILSGVTFSDMLVVEGSGGVVSDDDAEEDIRGEAVESGSVTADVLAGCSDCDFVRAEGGCGIEGGNRLRLGTADGSVSWPRAA